MIFRNLLQYVRNMKIHVAFLSLALSVSLCGFAGNGGSDKDTLKLDAESAMRYARWKQCFRFGGTWTVSKDTSGTAWVVVAEKTKKVRKAFRDHNGSVYKCGTEDHCRMNIRRSMVIDEKTARILRRNQHRSFSKD